MAQVLGTDPSWEETYSAAVAKDALVNTAFRRLRSLGDHEPAILPAAGGGLVGGGLTLAHRLRAAACMPPALPRPLLRTVRAVQLGYPTRILDISHARIAAGFGRSYQPPVGKRGVGRRS